MMTNLKTKRYTKTYNNFLYAKEKHRSQRKNYPSLYRTCSSNLWGLEHELAGYCRSSFYIL